MMTTSQFHMRTKQHVRTIFSIAHRCLRSSGCHVNGVQHSAFPLHDSSWDAGATAHWYHSTAWHNYQIPSFNKADRLYNLQMMQLEFDSLKNAEKLYEEGKPKEARETLLSVLDWHNTNSFDAATCLFEHEPTADHLRRLEKTSQWYLLRDFMFQVLETLHAESISAGGRSLYQITSQEVMDKIDYARKWTPGEWNIEFNSTRPPEAVLSQMERYANLLREKEKK